MRVTDYIPETIMSDQDKAHVEWIAKRHDIKFFDHAMGMIMALKAGHDTLLRNRAASYSMMDQYTGEKALYLAFSERTPEEAYFVALHELGHAVLEHHQMPVEYRSTEKEIEAWEWAINHARYFPTDETLCMIMDSLSTYTDKDAADERPDSLLALAFPDAWEGHEGRSMSYFKKEVETGHGKFVMTGEGPKAISVPRKYAENLVHWIKLCLEEDHDTLKANLDRGITELRKVISKLSEKHL